MSHPRRLEQSGPGQLPVQAAPEIPVLTLPPRSAAANPADLALLVPQLAQACRSTGFFYLAPPDLDSAQIEQVFLQARAFFSLPVAAKMQIERSPQTNCGYVPLQAEALDPTRPGDYKEALNIGPANRWPTQPEAFQSVLATFYESCIQHLARPLLTVLALALDLPAPFFVERHRANFYLRLLHYPPLQADEQNPGPASLRAGAHTDYGTVTLLFQEENTSGLEILSQQGDWIAVPPRPGTILVNIGDALQRWTGDQWRSTPHQVLLPPANPPRYAIALFCDPDPMVEIAGLSQLAQADRADRPGPGTPPASYPPILYRDYLQSRFAATYTEPS